MNTQMLNVSWTAKACGTLAVLACVTSAWATGLQYGWSGGDSSGGGKHSEAIGKAGVFFSQVKCDMGLPKHAHSWVYGGIYAKGPTPVTCNALIGALIYQGSAKWFNFAKYRPATLWGDFGARILEWNGRSWIIVRESRRRFVTCGQSSHGYKTLRDMLSVAFRNVRLKAHTYYAFDGFVELRCSAGGVACAEIKIERGRMDILLALEDGPPGVYDEGEFLEAPPPPPDPMVAPSDIEEDAGEESADEIELWVDDTDLSELDEDTSDVFVRPATGTGGPEAAHLDSKIEPADINGDGRLDFADINPFIELLGSR